MTKSSMFVTIYSIVLLVLFFTLCYLMTTVNPTPLTQKETEKFNAEDFLYPDVGFLPKDDVRYGLERVEEYENIQQSQNVQDISSTQSQLTSETIKKSEYTYSIDTGMPQLLNTFNDSNQGVDVNGTVYQEDSLKSVTIPIQPQKDLRRSIKDENNNNTYQEVPQSLHFKIKDENGEPRVEIKVISGILQHNQAKNFSNSDTNIKTRLNTLAKLDNTEIKNKNVRKAFIKLGENETLILNIILNWSNPFKKKENKTSYYYSFKNSKSNVSRSNIFKNANTSLFTVANRSSYSGVRDTFFFDTNNNGSMFNSFKKFFTLSSNITKKSKDNITETTHSRPIYIKSYTEENISLSTSKFEDISITENKSNDSSVETDTGINYSRNSLMRLIIPESIATVPANYHFVK